MLPPTLPVMLPQPYPPPTPYPYPPPPPPPLPLPLPPYLTPHPHPPLPRPYLPPTHPPYSPPHPPPPHPNNPLSSDLQSSPVEGSPSGEEREREEDESVASSLASLPRSLGGCLVGATLRAFFLPGFTTLEGQAADGATSTWSTSTAGMRPPPSPPGPPHPTPTPHTPSRPPLLLPTPQKSTRRGRR